MSGRTDNRISRQDIPWFPRIDEMRCNGCGACVSFCPHSVYAEGDGKAEAANPYGCEVGCSGYVPKCPEGVISFPALTDPMDVLRTLRAKQGQEAR